MIVDAFTFYNELETLDIRLNHLDPVVDRFVLVEATKTHSGVDKPLFFKENMPRYQAFLKKITHVVVDTMPVVKEHERWPAENYQRNCIRLGFDHLNLNDDDYILVSDVDEIPRAELVGRRFQGVYDQRAFMYYLNVLITEHWNGTMGMNYGRFKNEFHYSSQEVRNKRDTSEPIRNGGWHFAWLGPSDRIINKLHSFAHSELDTPEIGEKVLDRINKLNPIWDANCTMVPIPIDDTFPEYIREHQKELGLFIHG
jgi:beta-1,4-mannosyl-glycoprotein beta-1,4-N-acetylglucosaminyltransferase